MGILDDLAMGFGMKERTADYDARTARTIAANRAEQDARDRGAGDHEAMVTGIRARQSYNPSEPTGQSAYYLNRAGARGGYDPGTYRPAIAQDSRPFIQRLLFSPQGAASPNPYAIGPMSFNQPLPMPGLLGILGYASGLLGPRVPPTVSAPKGAMRGRPAGYTSPTGLTDDDMGLPDAPVSVPDIRLRRAAGTPTAPYDVASGSLLEDYDYLIDEDMTAEAGLAPTASDAPVTESDPEYDAFVEAARQDPLYAGVVDNPKAMRNIFNMYKDQMNQ